MKWSIFLLFVAVGVALADDVEAQRAEITLAMRNRSIAEVLKAVEQQTDFQFIYDSKVVDTERKVTVNADRQNIFDVLGQVFGKTDIAYTVSKDKIILTSSAEVNKLRESMARQQQGISVSGTVTDDNGQPLPGVNVVVKGTSSGTVTDADGKYRITVPNEQAVLQFSFVGYEPQEIVVGQDVDIAVSMKEGQQIEEVVVVGYGTQKKVNLSGAVSTVSAKMLESRSVTNANLALQGVAPGMNISLTEARVNQTPDINVRGYTSINGGSAFILVDNVPVTAAELSRINPSDIESVSVLKDAAAAAIYGARAAFGVVLITTKTAKSEKLEVNIDANYGVRQPFGLPNFVTDPYLNMTLSNETRRPLADIYTPNQIEYAKRVSEDPSLPTVIMSKDNPGYWDYYASTNWVDVVYAKTSPTYQANISIAQKGERLRYNVSSGYYQQNGLLNYNTDIYRRYNVRGNGDYKLTKWWNLGSIVSFNYSDYSYPTVMKGPGETSFYNLIVDQDPVRPIYNPDGTYTQAGLNTVGFLKEGGDTQERTYETQLSFNTKIDLLPEIWSLKADANFRFTNANTQAANMPVPYRTGPGMAMLTDRGGDGATSYARNGNGRTQYTVYNIYTDFHKTFAEKHFLQALVGFNQEYMYYQYFDVRKDGLISNSYPVFVLATGAMSGGMDINELALRGVFYRLNYIFDNKYIVEMNARNDATSRYPEGKRWGFFPSASAAWVLSNERFMEGVNETLRISNLKFRGSYGNLGNQVQNNYYPYIAQMGSGITGIGLDGAQQSYIGAPGTISTNLTWEKVTTANFGVDLAMFKNRLNLSFDKYTRYTKGMLTKSKSLPGIFGVSEPQANAADLKTNGWELTASYRDHLTLGGSPFTYELRAMVWDSRAWITKYDNPDKILTDYREGQEIGEIWGLETAGFFQSQEELDNWPDQRDVGSDDTGYAFYVGDLKFNNLDAETDKISYGKGTVDDPGDRRIIGNDRPRYSYSFEGNFTWKGFDLRLFFQGIGKRDWYPAAMNKTFWSIYYQPWVTPTWDVVNNHWTEDNRNAYFPRLKAYIAEDNPRGATYGGSELSTPQTRYLQNAAYLRLKNLTLGYTLPEQLTSKWNIKRLRVYFSGENLFTIQHIFVKNVDAETGINLWGGLSYPMQRVYSFGFNLSF